MTLESGEAERDRNTVVALAACTRLSHSDIAQQHSTGLVDILRTSSKALTPLATHFPSEVSESDSSNPPQKLAQALARYGCSTPRLLRRKQLYGTVCCQNGFRALVTS